MDDSKFALGVIFLIAIVAIAGGGVKIGGLNTNTASSTTPGQYISSGNNSTQTDEIENTIRKAQTEIKKLNEEKNSSVYKGKIFIQSVLGAGSGEEMAVLSAGYLGGESQINITGWKIKSENTGRGFTIPQSATLYSETGPNAYQNILLKQGDQVYLISGRSPVSVNFKINKCSGYLNQTRAFIPSIDLACPSPKKELNPFLSSGTEEDNRCADYLETFPRCKSKTYNFPDDLSRTCTDFISNTFNYGSCVASHKYDSDFWGSEWRIYIGQYGTYWKAEREKITLYDGQGKVVDTYSY